MNKLRIKSPFLLGAGSCFSAILGDMIWIISSILKEAGLIMSVTGFHILVIIAFLLSFILMVVSVVRYINNGYITKECSDELAHRRRKSNFFQIKHAK